MGVQQREIQYNSLEDRQRGLEVLLFPILPQGTDPLIFHDLRLEFFSIPKMLLQSIVNQTIWLINVINLSTEFSKGKTDKDKDKDFDSADIKEVNYHTISISQIASAFDLSANRSC